MPAPAVELNCPFCSTPLAARLRICPHCKAERRSAAGMTPVRFQLFVALWSGLALLLMAFALYLAALPWTRTGSPPGYALALLGANPAGPGSRCRLVVFHADGRRSEATSDSPCEPTAQRASGASEAIETAAPSTSTRRLAAAIHGALCLAGGALAGWLLLAPLRLLFRRRGAGNWVRRVAA
ncbi:hypothetical protein PE066_02465 [Ramlibacter tataouinensis]|uniref:hypothetical protein n=1 Tax=Ramlibacter tataouinensis TaxID=94132 RepID=UPI0022F3E022|nr:hypothetical protein [Ramlibacter tataouinensis]WBY02418.1 hypothetical protein PE066_02465 [Ramlibacter tataouinensis]